MKALLLTVALLLGCVTVSSQDKDTGIITVSTNDLSMVFSISPDKKVVYNYFGDKFQDVSPFLHKKYKEQPDNGIGYAPVIYPAYGGRFFLNPALKLTHDDGVQTTELIYAAHQVKNIDNNRIETVIQLKDPLYPVFVNLNFTAYQKENVICQSVSISHQEKNKLAVENIASAYLPLHADSYYLTHFHGAWASEMQLVEEQLTPGVKRVESKKGIRTTQSENSSFLLSLNGPANEDMGEVYAGSLAWSGNYLSSFEIDECGLLHVMSGMNDFASTYNLEPGKTLQTPEMVWTYSSTGKGQVSRNLHDWSRNYASAHGDQELPIVLNSWEGAYFDFNEKTITDMIDDAAAFGVEMFVLDDGWFGNKYPRNSDKVGLGDWQVNRKKLPRGIDYLAKHAVSKGLKFGIWIEPEMVSPKSELAEKHPEWIVKSGKRDIIPMRNQWLLDLSNPEVQDFVVKTFDEVIALSPDISYIKWDANRHVDNFGSEYLSKENQTHFWIDYTKGLYSVYERIRAKHPDVLIQLCSSGGGRLDFGALKYHDEFWASDNTNSLDRIFIQYSTNLFFPAKATAAHVSTTPNHQTGMMAPLKFRFDVAMTGRLGMELQPKRMDDAEKRFARKAVASYKAYRDIVMEGDLYRIGTPYDDTGYYGMMYVSKDKKKAVLFTYCIRYQSRTLIPKFRLHGLDAKTRYTVREQNTDKKRFWFDGGTFTGEYLANAGINPNLSKIYDSAVFVLEAQ